ncbi:MAG: hypothetical protein KDE27_04480, partial [Planctomycetes bacterium]|nr:hypothetical protein [Planctomycetota bacterium]
LFGADEIRGIDLSGYDLATRAAVLDEAGRFGVALEHGDGSRRAAGAVFALERPFDLASVLARPASEPTLFELTAPPGTPERILRTLLGALPAVAESAAGRRPPAVAVLAGRIGALLRYATLR